MKKFFFVFMMLAMVTSALGFQVTRAQAANWITYEDSAYVEGKGIVYIFSAAGHRTRDVKGASIYVGSDFYDLFCWVTEDKEHIVCNAQGGLTQFAGQTAIIYLAGQIFYVTIPSRGEPEEGEGLTCGEDEILGADVTFLTSTPSFITLFIDGSSIAEVESNATSFLGGFFVAIDSIGSLYCLPFSEEQSPD